MKTLKSKFSTFGLIIMVSLFISSCGESKGWSDENKEQFLSGCVKGKTKTVSEEKANELCNCMLDKMEEKFPTMVESQSMNIEDIKELATACK